MNTINPASYWRKNHDWKNLLGKKGKVILSAESFVMVEIDSKNYEFTPASVNILKTGDPVICVLRRLTQTTPNGLIEYGISVKAIQPQP